MQKEILRQLDDIAYLAEALEVGNQFEHDLKSFKDLHEVLKQNLLTTTTDPRIRTAILKMPRLENTTPPRNLLEQLLPSSSRKMWDTYKTRENIRQKVREIDRIYRRIRSWLGDEYV